MNDASFVGVFQGFCDLAGDEDGFFERDRSGGDAGRVEDWRRCSVGPAYPLLPVSVGSASLTRP